MNLLLNATEAMEDSGGEFMVKSELQDGHLQFSVSDSFDHPKRVPRLNSANTALGMSVDQAGRFSFFKNAAYRGSMQPSKALDAPPHWSFHVASASM